jgi:outer membrane murein-binding lipoprotein Lpp
MPDWLPWVIALGGGGGIGALITAFVNARSSLATQMNAFIDQLQEDRKTDRESVKELGAKVDNALLHLQIEREYSADLYVWGVNGAPPPPPVRRTIIAPPSP